MVPNSSNLVWIDLEMTGLDPDTEKIIEIATIVTDASLRVLADGPEIAIRQTAGVLAAMDEWNTEQHGGSGLTERVLASTCAEEEAEARTLAFLERWVPPRTSPMCGNSVCLDRRFLHRHMPRLESFFHYRNLDVSTLKELCLRWAPEKAGKLVKRAEHRALQDIRGSIAELRFYRDELLRLD
ncbi:MAG: oligoribonuclease [Chromatiales bacterium]|nr:oligoribonuclease [Chromatiales bacterium]